MANEALVGAVKKIAGLAREGKAGEAYAGYEALFSSPVFSTYEPADQRQALRLMVLAKTQPEKGMPAVVAAHRAAIAPLTKLVADHGEPSDHELLGVCHLVIGDEAKASAVLRAGLTLERERNPGSDLCGNLMKRVSLI